MSLLIRSLVLVVLTGWWGTATAGQIQATDIVSVDGVEWAQPDLFIGLSWAEIDAVCPQGRCDGELSGLNMGGWIWASIDDMNALFNDYIGYAALGPGPDDWDSAFRTGGYECRDFFINDGWRPTETFEEFYGIGGRGRVADSMTMVPTIGGILDFNCSIDTGSDVTGTLEPLGAWFYHGVSEVPIPAAAWLFGSAMLGLMGVARRKKA